VPDAHFARPEELRDLAVPLLRTDPLLEPDPTVALQKAKALAGPDDLICITGSFYLAGAIASTLTDYSPMP
jgi:dihydrofolate synthase/folylpolyglutamate synthase